MTRLFLNLALGLATFGSTASLAQTHMKALPKTPASSAEDAINDEEALLTTLGPDEIIASAQALIEMLQREAQTPEEKQAVAIQAHRISEIAGALRDQVVQRREAPFAFIIPLLGADISSPKLLGVGAQGSYVVIAMKQKGSLAPKFFLATLAGPGMEIGRVLGPLSSFSSHLFKKMISPKQAKIDAIQDDAQQRIDAVKGKKPKYDAYDLSFLWTGGVIFGNIGEDSKTIKRASDILGGAPYIGLDFEPATRIKAGGGVFVRPNLGQHYLANDSHSAGAITKDIAQGIAKDTQEFVSDLGTAIKGLDANAAWSEIKERSSAVMILAYAGLGTKTPHVKVQGQMLFLNAVGENSSVDKLFYDQQMPRFDAVRALQDRQSE